MVKFTYIDFIKAIENENTKKIIGSIDIEILKTNSIESLYYSFPLIERITLEIFKLIPDSNVEHIEQGTMKTIKEIIEENNKCFVIPEETHNKILNYYGDNGIRNDLFHPHDEVFSATINFNEINFVIFQLISILNQKITELNDVEFKKIDFL